MPTIEDLFKQLGPTQGLMQAFGRSCLNWRDRVFDLSVIYTACTTSYPYGFGTSIKRICEQSEDPNQLKRLVMHAVDLEMLGIIQKYSEAKHTIKLNRDNHHRNSLPEVTTSISLTTLETSIHHLYWAQCISLNELATLSDEKHKWLIVNSEPIATLCVSRKWNIQVIAELPEDQQTWLFQHANDIDTLLSQGDASKSWRQLREILVQQGHWLLSRPDTLASILKTVATDHRSQFINWLLETTSKFNDDQRTWTWEHPGALADIFNAYQGSSTLPDPDSLHRFLNSEERKQLLDPQFNYFTYEKKKTLSITAQAVLGDELSQRIPENLLLSVVDKPDYDLEKFKTLLIKLRLVSVTFICFLIERAPLGSLYLLTREQILRLNALAIEKVYQKHPTFCSVNEVLALAPQKQELAVSRADFIMQIKRHLHNQETIYSQPSKKTFTEAYCSLSLETYLALTEDDVAFIVSDDFYRSLRITLDLFKMSLNDFIALGNIRKNYPRFIQGKWRHSVLPLRQFDYYSMEYWLQLPQDTLNWLARDDNSFNVKHYLELRKESIADELVLFNNGLLNALRKQHKNSQAILFQTKDPSLSATWADTLNETQAQWIIGHSKTLLNYFCYKKDRRPADRDLIMQCMDIVPSKLFNLTACFKLHDDKKLIWVHDNKDHLIRFFHGYKGDELSPFSMVYMDNDLPELLVRPETELTAEQYLRISENDKVWLSTYIDTLHNMYDLLKERAPSIGTLLEKPTIYKNWLLTSSRYQTLDKLLQQVGVSLRDFLSLNCDETHARPLLNWLNHADWYNSAPTNCNKMNTLYQNIEKEEKKALLSRLEFLALSLETRELLLLPQAGFFMTQSEENADSKNLLQSPGLAQVAFKLSSRYRENDHYLPSLPVFCQITPKYIDWILRNHEALKPLLRISHDLLLSYLKSTPSDESLALLIDLRFHVNNEASAEELYQQLDSSTSETPNFKAASEQRHQILNQLETLHAEAQTQVVPDARHGRRKSVQAWGEEIDWVERVSQQLQRSSSIALWHCLKAQTESPGNHAEALQTALTPKPSIQKKLRFTDPNHKSNFPIVNHVCSRVSMASGIISGVLLFTLPIAYILPQFLLPGIIIGATLAVLTICLGITTLLHSRGSMKASIFKEAEAMHTRCEELTARTSVTPHGE